MPYVVLVSQSTLFDDELSVIENKAAHNSKAHIEVSLIKWKKVSYDSLKNIFSVILERSLLIQ